MKSVGAHKIMNGTGIPAMTTEEKTKRRKSMQVIMIM